MEVLRIHDLTLIPNTTESIETAEEQMVLDMYFDDRYGNMEPIFCFTVQGLDVGPSEACVVKIDEAFALPILNHFGEYEFDSGSLPIKCDW